MAFKHNQGVSLLEMMIALVISSVLLIEIFRYSYLLENSAMFSLHNVEFVEKENVLFSWLAQDIEKAGYVACVDAKSRKNIIDDTGSLQSVWLSATDNTLFSQYMSAQQWPILQQTESNEIIIDGSSHLKVDDIVFLANCYDAQVLKIQKIGSVNYGAQNRIVFYSSIKLPESSNNFYLGKLIQHHYFIKTNSLYMQDERGNSDEMVENIQSLRFSWSQNMWTITAYAANATTPMILTAKTYNA